MTNPLSSPERAAYEQYLASGGSDSSLEAALAQLIQGSPEYYYLKFLHKLKKKGISKWSAEEVEEFVSYTEKGRHQNTWQAQNIKLRHDLLNFDETKDAEAQKKVIDMIISQSGFNFHHQKPNRTDIRIAGTEEEKVVYQDTVDNEALFKNTAMSELLRKLNYFKDEARRQTERNAPQGSDQIQASLGQNQLNAFKEAFDKERIEHDFDYTLIFPECVYKAACWMVQRGGDRLAAITNESFFKQLTVLIKGMRDTEKDKFAYFRFDTSLAQNMTHNQLTKLGELDEWYKTEENIVGALFQKKFCEELSAEFQEGISNAEKLANVEKLYKSAATAKLPVSFQLEFLVEILTLGPKIGVYNEVLFRQFLTLIKKDDENFKGYADWVMSEQKKSTVSKEKTVWRQFISNVRSSFTTNIDSGAENRTLIQKYLNYFCENNKCSLAPFAKDFEEKLLKKIEANCLIYQASEGMVGFDQIDYDKFKAINDVVLLEFDEQNKDTFSVEEQVELTLKVKNVKVLHVKIFEFNTETYYKKNLKAFDSSVNLDGLEPSGILEFAYPQASNIRHKEVFNFPQLNKRVGLFIIEFIGNGVSARAVIKKGSLSIVHRVTSAGHLAYILDEKKQVCKGARTGIWIENKFIQAKKDTGALMIPYGMSNQTFTIIMVHDSFAQISQFERKTESFSFSAQFFLVDEALIVGTIATVVVSAQLLVNGRTTTLGLLKNTKIVLKTHNYIDDIPVTKNFDGLEFQNDKELTLSFQVPPNLSHIRLDLTTEVLNATTRQTLNFQASDTVQMQSSVSSPNPMVAAYLRREKGVYNLIFLGKNGEPQVGKWVNMMFNHRFLGNLSNQRQSNKEGKVILGELTDVLNVHARCDELNVTGSWVLSHINHNSSSSFWTYPTMIEILQGGSFELPYKPVESCSKEQTLAKGPCTQAPKRSHLQFVRRMNEVIVEDCFSQVKLVHDGEDHIFSFENVKAGTYTLVFATGKSVQNVQVVVHKGSLWNEDENFILKTNSLQQITSNPDMLRISNFDRSAQKHKVVIKNCSKKVRLHVIATHFCAADDTKLANMLYNLSKNQNASQIFTFAMWKNLFQSNRQIADEIRYVLDRKEQEKQLGNTLDRPTLLMKRLFTQKTRMDNEVLSEGDKLVSVQESMMASRSMAPPMAACAFGAGPPMARKMCAPQRFSGGGGNNMVMPAQGPLEFQNFLKEAPLQLFNVELTETNEENTYEAVFNVDLQPYTQLLLIAVDENAVNLKTISFGSDDKIPSRDLRLKQALDNTKGLTQTRETSLLAKDDKNTGLKKSDFIEDITSSEVQLVDDLTKVEGILKEIRKMNGSVQTSEHWKKFEIVHKWSSFNTTEKNRYFSEFACHELNLFLFHKDQEYFQKVVKPFIESKMEQTFVDFYLLGDWTKVCSYADLQKVVCLNALETCLMIDGLVRSGQFDVAKVYAENMQLEQFHKKEGEEVNQENKIFDLVLNLNSTSGTTNAFGELQKNAQRSRDRMESAEFKTAGFGSGAHMDLMMAMECEEMDDDDGVEVGECFKERASSPKRIKKRKMGKIHGKMAEDDDDEYNQMRQEQLNKVSFEKVEATSEYMETHYFGETHLERFQNLVSNNDFWVDYAKHLLTPVDQRGSFLTQNFTKCANQDRDVHLALCLVDLPFESQATHDFKTDSGRGVTITAGSNLILFKKEIKLATIDKKDDILVIHRYRARDAPADADSLTEFLTNTCYRCEVIITNVSPKTKEFSLLYQIPQGSLPLFTTKYMKSSHMTLQSYSTTRIVFDFYFPATGNFAHFPSNVSVDQLVLSRSNENILKVVKSRTVTNIENFQDLIATGSPQQVLEFLQKENLFNSTKGFSLDQILFLLKDKAFFHQVIDVLRKRKIPAPQVWSYAFFHKDDPQLMRECIMQHRNHSLFTKIGTYFSSGLISIDKENAKVGFLKYLEYHPMINARAHKIGKTNHQNILNVTFRETYDRFLASTVQKEQLAFEDKLIFVYYLQLQDRIPEAMKLFKTLQQPAEHDSLRIQYDYLLAYFDFFNQEKNYNYLAARQIVRKYDNYPVSSWKLMFLTIEDQLNELDGDFDQPEEVTSQDALVLKEAKQATLKKSMKREPNLASLDMNDKGTLRLESANIPSITINYYNIDAEVLFSRAPFLKENASEFSYVKPFQTVVCPMFPADADEQTRNSYQAVEVPIPKALEHKNMVIEVLADGKQEFRTFYSNNLKVVLLESFGELKVTHAETNKPVPSVYVKVFAQQKNGSKDIFYKDGYTDIRGKFDYSQTSGDKLGDVKKFAILVASDEFGSKIVEIDPPKEDNNVSALARLEQRVAQSRKGQ